MMTSSFGQVFEGSINAQYRITGQVTGYCTYDLTFQKNLTLTQRLPIAMVELSSEIEEKPCVSFTLMSGGPRRHSRLF
jgi:hypothetical protein